MFKLDRLLLTFTNPKRFLNGLCRYFDWLILDKIFRLFAILIFGLGPSFLYILYGKGLIQKKARCKKKITPKMTGSTEIKKKSLTKLILSAEVLL
jgi:hypothetical protein